MIHGGPEGFNNIANDIIKLFKSQIKVVSGYQLPSNAREELIYILRTRQRLDGDDDIVLRIIDYFKSQIKAIDLREVMTMLNTMTALVRLRYGNSDKGIYIKIMEAEKMVDEYLKKYLP